MIRLVAVAAFATSLLVAWAPTSAAGDKFYDVSAAELAGPPGSLIRILGMPNVQVTGAMVYRILYRSRGLSGEPIAVSGVVVAPIRRPPAGGWPVVAYAHGTTGIARYCALSLLPDPLYKIPGINQMIDNGFVVVATDYPGLGTIGPHPYLVGLSEGRAVLDSVRAVRQMTQANAGNRYALWGYSQGGHAVLWAGQLAASYASELKLVGLAAAAPASELSKLFTDDEHRLVGRVLSGLVLESWSKPQIYNAPLKVLINEADIPALDDIAKDCIDLVRGDLADLKANREMPSNYLKAQPSQVEPWKKLMAENVPATKPIGVPFYIAQGTGDTVVDPPITVNYVGELCRNGTVVRFQEFPKVTHSGIPKASHRDAIAWIKDRFDGKRAPNTCH